MRLRSGRDNVGFAKPFQKGDVEPREPRLVHLYVRQLTCRAPQLDLNGYKLAQRDLTQIVADATDEPLDEWLRAVTELSLKLVAKSVNQYLFRLW
jgi:hypothetical protein